VKQASFVIDPAFRIGAIDPRIRGSFVEHLGRCVYEGIYEPGHPTADDDGFRTDVLELTRELGISAVRYPGGNFVSGYNWEDGIGPKEDRPARLDLAWKSLETNQFGVDEFAAWCRKTGAEPVMAVNLGTRGVAEAMAILEYCNHPGGSLWSDRRIANGSKEPHNVKLWCLGNEMDGPWQIGYKTARDYGILAAQTARAMRMIDPDLELVACGSSNRRMSTFSAWEAEVLEHCYDVVDYISLHSYYRPQGDDLASFLASGVDMDAMIDEVVATCDFVKAKLRKQKTINLSYDEWNVWYSGGGNRPDFEPWTFAPHLCEDVYSRIDAVVVGSLLNSLLRHADRVTLACFAQLVNVIAPMTTEAGGPVWKQSTFHPMRLAFTYGRGHALRVEPTAPEVETSAFGGVSQLDATATIDDETGDVAIFAGNRSLEDALLLEVDLRALPGARAIEHLSIDGEHSDINTKDDPDRVVPHEKPVSAVEDGKLRVELPPASWGVIRLSTQQEN
jgi:alpha-L-arabinofuranosidase